MPNLWSFRRGTRSDLVDGAAAIDPTPVLEPIQVFTNAVHLTGFVESRGQRMTDVLNGGQSLRIRLPSGSWTTVNREDLLLLAPPPHGGDRRKRVHRQKRRIRALVGPYDLLGTAHMIPGIPLDPFLLRSRQHFLPMTNVWLTLRDDPDFAQDLDVALLNVANVHELHALLTLA